MTLAAIASNAPLTAAQARLCAAASPLLAKIAAAGDIAPRALEEAVRKHSVIDRPQAGEVLIRKGAFGGDAFFLLRGRVQVLAEVPPHLPLRAAPDRRRPRRGGAPAWRWRLLRLLRLWRARRLQIPEVRHRGEQAPTVALESGAARPVFSAADRAAIAEKCETRTLDAVTGGVIGGLGALAYGGQRAATIFAEEDAVLIRMHWRGVRALFAGSAAFREALRREKGGAEIVRNLLSEFALFAGLPPAALDEIAERSTLEIYGERGRAGCEEAVIKEGEYLNGLLLVVAGFGRVSGKQDAGERTFRYLRRGDIFGLRTLRRALADGRPPVSSRTLRVVNYLELVSVPARLAEAALRAADLVKTPGERRPSPAAADFLVGNFLINGKKAMLIDLDRCVHCDDCVRACAAAHGGNPRFVRAGPVFMNVMVASACMHCAEPLCLRDCPTGAIRRDEDSGNVVIEEQKCIGCASCADNCIYGNIRMAQTRDPAGAFAFGAESPMPVAKATKCNFCQGIAAGPACERACPHGALVRADICESAAFAADD